MSEQQVSRANDTVRVSDVASTPVVAVRSDLEAFEALQEMYRRRIHHLAVVYGTEVIGLVSATDLLYGIATQTLEVPAKVSSLCRIPAPQVSAGEEISVIARHMIEAHTDAVLVMKGGKVDGMFTAVDLVEAVACSASAGPTSSGAEAEGDRDDV